MAGVADLGAGNSHSVIWTVVPAEFILGRIKFFG
jgi:hypothetical protein